MKRALSVLLILLILCGCASPKIIDGEIIVDLTEEFNVNSILKNVKKNTEVAYQLDEENSKIIVSLTRKNRTKTLEKEVTIVEPKYKIKDEIKFNPYLDYNINDFITVDEGVKVEHTIDTKASKLTFNLSKGIWSKTIEKDVTLESILDMSNISEYGALIYKATKWENRPALFTRAFYNKYPGIGSLDVYAFAQDHTGFCIRYNEKGAIPFENTFIWSEDGKITFDNKLTVLSTPIFGGIDGLEEYLIIEDDNTIRINTDENGNEYFCLEKVDSFVQPYNTFDFLVSEGTYPGRVWPMVENLDSFWYEPDFVKYINDYNGVKKFASKMRWE